MSIGPMNLLGSVAGSQLPQAKGTDTEQAQQAANAQERQIDSDKKAENASGVGEMEEDQETSDRDADGRRLLERPAESESSSTNDEETRDPRQSRDPSGDRGANIDLSG